MNRRACVVGLTALGVWWGGLAVAEAATAERFYMSSATGFCQPALPVFDGNIRKRPTAVANEGTSNAFVSCSMPTAGDSSTGITTIVLFFHNRGSTAVTFTCSLVHAFQAGSLIVPKAIDIPGHDTNGQAWFRADVGNPASMSFANFSCNLPASVEISYGYYPYSYEVGA